MPAIFNVGAIPIPSSSLGDTDWANMTGLSAEVQPGSATFIDSGIVSGFSDSPWLSACQGQYQGYPQPKVVVNYLTTTVTQSTSPAYSSAAASASPIAFPVPVTATLTSTNPAPPSRPPLFQTSEGNSQATNVVPTYSAPGGRMPQSVVPSALITVNGQTYIADRSGLVLPSTTLLPGASGVIIGNEIISLNGNGVVVSRLSPGIANFIMSGLGSTVVGALGSATTISFSTKAAIITTGGVVITELSGRVFMVGTTILTAGGPDATISGEVVTVGTSGVVVSGLSNSVHTSANVAVETGAGASSRYLDGHVFWPILASMFIWQMWPAAF
jgi:hypothetical protein